MMIRTLTAPAVPVVSTSDMKTHLRVTHTADDAWITGAVTAATNRVQGKIRQSLITQTKRLNLDRFERVIELVEGPVQSVTSVTYTNSAYDATVLDASAYEVDTESNPGRLAATFGTHWPTDTLNVFSGVRIDYVAGYGDAASDVPERFVNVIKQLVTHWYENRGDEDATSGYAGFDNDLAGDVIHRL